MVCCKKYEQEFVPIQNWKLDNRRNNMGSIAYPSGLIYCPDIKIPS
jgi:hypothetical protein